MIAFPAPLQAAGVEGHLDRFGPALIDGWITIAANPSPVPVIEIVENGQPVGSFAADVWRTDLQEIRQGDGRWGFTALPPAALADGAEHLVSLRLASGEALLPGLIRVRFEPGADRAPLPRLRPPPFEPETPCRTRAAPVTQLGGDGVLISIIVVFYNMPREAARTLTALSRAYQQGIETLTYEVICIDNGSNPPMDAAWVESFGPEFRLVRPERPMASPVAAMNAAARTARGHHLAMMIDGAHILTPGVLCETAWAIVEAPKAVIGLRQWFIAGDQRFLSQHGWTAGHEDMLFDRIAWPSDGYHLFRIGTPVWESPNHWFDGMSESNCLFVPASVWAKIGGFDEAFDEPGAGYANLDLFRRAYEATDEPLVALLGEASFHQFHGGTTTNVENDEKERRVRVYAYKYAQLRGKPWAPVDPGSIRVRGQMRTREGLVARQRPLSAARVGVTTEVRAAEMSTHFDAMATDYLVSLYAEAGLRDEMRWQGMPLGVAPPDAFAMAAILYETRPQCVVAVNLPAGLLAFLRDALAMAGQGGRIVVVGQDGIGGSYDADPLRPETLAAVRRAIGTATEISVFYAPRPQDALPLAELHAYGEFVSLRSYLTVVGSAMGQPWLGYARSWTMKAINSFADVAPFAIDATRTQHLITSCPLGFLQRIGPVLTGEEGSAPALVGVS